MSVKDVSLSLGFKDRENLKIMDGLQALFEYKRFLETGDNEIKKSLLDYNKYDLERCELVFRKLKDLFSSHALLRTH